MAASTAMANWNKTVYRQENWNQAAQGIEFCKRINRPWLPKASNKRRNGQGGRRLGRRFIPPKS